VSATELQTDKDEFLIIGCDGVWDVVNYQEVRPSLSRSLAFFSSLLVSLMMMATRV
jgi:serine/threonine protein phosphatase PrpC